MKHLLATCADDGLKSYSDYTLPILQKYAKKWGADFLILDKLDSEKGRGGWCYRSLCFYDLLKEKYDRIACLDADIIINNNCPNPFDVVPPDTVGAVTEDRGSRQAERQSRIKQIQAFFGEDTGWREGFFNMGFYVVSRMHREMFQPYNGKLWKDRGWDSLFYSFQIHRLGFKDMDLGFRWNHMSMFSEPWNGNSSRFDSHILHYAGNANFPDKGRLTREQLIKRDAIKLYPELFGN